MAQQSPDEFGPAQIEQRLQKILQGAFDGPPTPLKDIPTKEGVSRAKRAKKNGHSSNHRRKRRKKAA